MMAAGAYVVQEAAELMDYVEATPGTKRKAILNSCLPDHLMHNHVQPTRQQNKQQLCNLLEIASPIFLAEQLSIRFLPYAL